MEFSIPITIIFIWLVLIWLSLLSIGRALRKMGVALETQVVTLILMLRREQDTESLLDTLDDLEEEAKNANSKNAG